MVRAPSPPKSKPSDGPCQYTRRSPAFLVYRMPSPYRSPATTAPPASCPRTYPLGRPHWLPAFSTICASPREIVPKNRCPASMTSFEEYCPLCEGGLLASGGLLAGGGPLAGGGYACARADSAPQGTRARTRRVVRI